MKPLYQFALGFILLIIVIVIGFINSDISNIPLRVIQYVISAIAGILMGNAVSRKL